MNWPHKDLVMCVPKDEGKRERRKKAGDLKIRKFKLLNKNSSNLILYLSIFFFFLNVSYVHFTPDNGAFSLESEWLKS